MDQAWGGPIPAKTESCSACQGLIMHAQLPNQGNAEVNLTGLVRRVGTRAGNLDGPEK